MSVVFIVATHGTAAKEILATCELLIGKQDQVHTVEFVPGEDAEDLQGKYREIMSKYPQGTKFVFLLDLWGGSPFNAANAVTSKDENSIIVTGVNVPALISAVEARDESEDLAEIAKEAIDGGRKGVRCNYQAQEKFGYSAPKAQVATPAAQSNYNGPDKRGSTEVEAANNDKAFKIALCRIDDRLIHGQVATVMVKAANASRILVVNDDIAKDPVRSSLLKQATPPDVTAHVVSVAKASRVYNNPAYAGERFFILVNNPNDVLRLVRDAKWPLPSVNVGGLSFKEGKVNLSRSVNVNEDEVKAFRELDKLGVKLEIKMVTNDAGQNLMPLINEKFPK